MRSTATISAGFILVLAVCSGGCFGTRAHDGFFLLRWVEKPSNRGLWEETPKRDRCEFSRVAVFDHRKDGARFAEIRDGLREGDVVGYWLSGGEVGRALVRGRLTKVLYGLFKYGHLGILVEDPEEPGRLVMFSSEGFKGPNVTEDVEALEGHSFDVFRLDQGSRLDVERLREFARLSMEKAGKWTGYDFSGMFGLWNDELQPSQPEEIGKEYICSTTVIAALYYSGVELETTHRRGVLDVITPLQVVASKGRIIVLPDMQVEVVTFE